MPNVLVFLA